MREAESRDTSILPKKPIIAVFNDKHIAKEYHYLQNQKKKVHDCETGKVEALTEL